MPDRVTVCSATLGEDGKLEPPLGPLYIAGALEEVGVDVDFRDFQLAPCVSCMSGRPLAEFLADHAPIVAVSCFVDMLPAVIEATSVLRARRPDTTVILGGPGPSAAAARILALYPWIDGVVRGEGEQTIQEWIGRHRRTAVGGPPIRGMTYRDMDRIVCGPDRERALDLGAGPRPSYHLVDWPAYTYARVVTTRGCAYRCSFCDVTALWGNRSVYRDLDDVIDEMLTLRDTHGKHTISIVDDTFVQDRKRVRAFCSRLVERRAGIEWGCFARINLMSPELVECMAEAGCCAVFYGIDSGSPRVLARTHKMVRAEDVVPVIRYSAAAFAYVEASFIWGYPFETYEDFLLTRDLAAEVSRYAPRVNVQFHMLSPLPNSPVYREHDGPLVPPDPEDRRWLLLPPILLEESASRVRQLVASAPDVYPGFYTFPTPSKAQKRDVLEEIVSALNATIGATMLDPQVSRLVDTDAEDVERALLERETDPCDRIGVGLAISFLRRCRHHRRRPERPCPAGTRGAVLVRQRNETLYN
jgi:anaerobic magnesium-protoporphyrin IX monomethyl ester cyclase